jgi:hypothetical protein
MLTSPYYRGAETDGGRPLPTPSVRSSYAVAGATGSTKIRRSAERAS